MASKVSGIIEKIQPNGSSGTSYAIASTAYGYCETTANEAAKVIDMTGFKLYEGVTIHIKFKYANTAASPTLNVNSTGAKTVAFGIMSADTDGTIGWRADDIVEFTYDGTSWVVNNSAYATRAGSILANNVKPIATKTYNMNLYNSSTGANFYQTFATVTPVNYNEMWIASYRITITASGHLDYTEISYVSISGRANTYYSYYIYNSLINYPIYYHTYLPSSSASTPHELGYRMASSYGATDVQKVAKVELLEQTNCTVTLLDSLKLYTSSVPSGYYTWYNFNATSNGLQEAGDANDTAYYFLTNGFKGKVGANKIYRYCLFARTSDGSYESFVMQDNTRATTKTVNPHGFVPDGKIYWNANNTVYSQGTLNFNPYEQYHVIDYLYSFNFNNTFLPDYCETYIVWTYNSTDGLLYLDTTQWLAAGLPTTADGKIYQRIGSKYYTGTSNYYQGSLLLDNPYYEYKNGAIHEWNGRAADAATVNGLTVQTAVPQNALFTDKYHKTGSWNGLTYTATAVNSADELKFTIPNKIQTNWELNATSGNSPSLLFTRDGSLTDWKIYVTGGKLSFCSALNASTWTERAYFADNSGNFTTTGTVTATGFNGPLTGNVTGDVSGTAANVTGTVTVAHGGTGATSFTDGCVIIPSTASSVQTFSSSGLKITGAQGANITLAPDTASKTMTISSTTGAMTISTTTAALSISSTTGAMTLSTGNGALEAKSTGTGTVKLTSNSGTMTLSTTSGNMSLSSGGTVSITSGSSKSLSISSGSTVSISSTTTMSITSTTSTALSATTTMSISGTQGTTINSGNGYATVFKINNTEYGRFNTSGMFQLNDTGTQNTHKLYVNGDSAFNGKIAIGEQVSNVITEKVYMKWNATDLSLDFIFA